MMDHDIKTGLAFLIGFLMSMGGIGLQYGWANAMIFAGFVTCLMALHDHLKDEL